jgi:cation transport ATPase
MRTVVFRVFAVLAFGFGGAALPNAVQAQLQTVDQTVFGMDCAPCAHAMEQSLGSMEGVETVSVHLNDGVAALDLTETNTVAYREILEAVSNGGFSAREATLTVQGTVRRTGGHWVLETPAGEQFVLKTDGSTGAKPSALQDLAPSRRVIVTGRVSASSETEDGRWPVEVQEVRSAA